MAKKLKDIPEAELEVLSALWRLGRGTVREVRETLDQDGRRLAHTTVLTLLARLEKKAHVRCDREGPANVYRPTTTRARVTAARLGDLVQRLGEGKATPLILQLMEANDLSTDDIRQLKEFLGDLEIGGRGRSGGDRKHR